MTACGITRNRTIGNLAIINFERAIDLLNIYIDLYLKGQTSGKIVSTEAEDGSGESPINEFTSLLIVWRMIKNSLKMQDVIDAWSVWPNTLLLSEIFIKSRCQLKSLNCTRQYTKRRRLPL